MSLVDAARRGPDSDVPQEWRARRAVVDGTTEVVTGPIEPVETDAALLRKFGYDPDEIELVGTINQWRKQVGEDENDPKSWRVSYFFKHRPRAGAHSLPALYAAARRRPRKQVTQAAADRITVVALSDMQYGKVGSRGGTPELIERLAEKRVALEAELRKRRPRSVVLLEVGDVFEGFESGGNPMFTNDVSLSQQIDGSSTEVFEFVRLAARFGHVDVVPVPSNHTAWRAGKQQLGRPGDDLGLLAHRQIRKLAAAAGIDVDWHFPAEYDESVLFEPGEGFPSIGVAHGNQFAPLSGALWWAKQTHGGQPVGAADILVTGHYHHLFVLPSGRNPYTAQSKWWLQAPTLDNGSDWYRNKAGDDSDPGLLVFDIVRERGFDLQSLTVL